MNELKKSANLSLKLTAEVLIQGALSLEQRESEKIFQLLKKGLENLIAQNKVHNRVAKQFKQLKQRKEKKMSFSEIKEKMLNDFNWITSLSDEELAGVLDSLVKVATTYDEWKFIHWCDWPKEIESIAKKRSNALLKMAQTATNDHELEETFELCTNDISDSDIYNHLKAEAYMDIEELEKAEAYMVSKIIEKKKSPIALQPFIRISKKKGRKMLSEYLFSLDAPRTEWAQFCADGYLTRRTIAEKIFVGNISNNQIVEVTRVYYQHGGYNIHATGEEARGSFFHRLEESVERLEVNQLLELAELEFDNFHFESIRWIIWEALMKKEQELNDANWEKIVRAFENAKVSELVPGHHAQPEQISKRISEAKIILGLKEEKK